MSRRRLLWRNGDWLEIPEGYTPARKGPYIISDTQAAFKSMADGKMYDSKSQYRRSLREQGYVEMGNDLPQQKTYQPANVGKDIKDAIEQVRAGKGATGADRAKLDASVSSGKTVV